MAKREKKPSIVLTVLQPYPLSLIRESWVTAKTYSVWQPSGLTPLARPDCWCHEKPPSPVLSGNTELANDSSELPNLSLWNIADGHVPACQWCYHIDLSLTHPATVCNRLAGWAWLSAWVYEWHDTPVFSSSCAEPLRKLNAFSENVWFLSFLSPCLKPDSHREQSWRCP